MVLAAALLTICDCDPHGESLPCSVFELHVPTVGVGSVVAECKELERRAPLFLYTTRWRMESQHLHQRAKEHTRHLTPYSCHLTPYTAVIPPLLVTLLIYPLTPNFTVPACRDNGYFTSNTTHPPYFCCRGSHVGGAAAAGRPTPARFFLLWSIWWVWIQKVLHLICFSE